ncbi:MAG: hypothetical protein COA69_12160 [Robiginitomaculum sp.]|nr:MAG: hypothetical protein COA69_12160 [Robiginitomaculum sp.]
MVNTANRIIVPKIWSILTVSFILVLVLAGCNADQSSAIQNQPPASEGPALWTLQDEDTIIHLFGLAPILKPGTAWKNDVYNTAFTQAHIVILDVDNTSPDMQTMVQRLGFYTDGSTLNGALDSLLSEAEHEEINAVSTGLGAPLIALNALKPWLANLQLGVMSLTQQGYDLASGGPTAALAIQAKDEGKTIRYMQEPEELLNMMSELSQEEQVNMLLHTARQLRDKPDQSAHIAKAWLDGDVDTIGAILHGKPNSWSSPLIYDTFVVQRNASWAKEIERLMQAETGTIFMAFGLGHLAGKDSLIGMLETAGFVPVRQ